MSLIRKHVAVLQAWACLALVIISSTSASAQRGSLPQSGIRHALHTTVYMQDP